MNTKRLNELYTFDFENGLLISKLRNGPVGADDGNGYLTVRIDGKKQYVHRILFFMRHGYLPERVDHKDTNRMNNRGDNLRPLTHAQNLLNRAKPAKGVYYHKQNDNWCAQLSGKHIGSFDTEQEALAARSQAYSAVFA